MADRVNPAALKASLGTLRGYLDDLVRSKFEDHATKLRLFVNYFQKDEQVRLLAERLRTRLGDVIEAAQSPAPRLPDDPRDQLAFVYGVLYHLKQGHKLEVRELLSRAFEGPSLDHKWAELRERWLKPFSAALEALESSAASPLGPELVEPDAVFRHALESLGTAGPAPTTHTSETHPTETHATAAPAPAASTPPDVAGTSTPTPTTPASAASGSALQQTIARLAPEARDDLALEAEILALERRKRRPDTRRLEEIVTGFERASPELGALARAEAGLPPRS